MFFISDILEPVTILELNLQGAKKKHLIVFLKRNLALLCQLKRFLITNTLIITPGILVCLIWPLTWKECRCKIFQKHCHTVVG